MKKIIQCSCLVVILSLFFAGCSKHGCCEELEIQEHESLVGRIAHIEGQLLRYVPDEDDWELTEADTPFGEYDNVFSSEDGKAEIVMPNNTVARIGADTQVQLIELNKDATEVDISSGTARLYNNSSSAQVRAATPFGDVILPPETACDVNVHEQHSEVASLKGTVEFTKTGSTVRQQVFEGSSSIIATSGQITASNQGVSPAWNEWNQHRDAQRTERMQARGDSEKHLPESLQEHAYELEQNGRWEPVYYDGAYHYFWRPAYVNAGWTPFSTGKWIVWHGERTWVPCEPFGYVTHHYGNWVYAGSSWYWAPPSYVGMYWYPGRVAWVSSSISIGWFPLAPYEIYYSSRYWGPRCKVKYYNNYYDCRRYRHYKHARYVNHKRFHGSKNYKHAGLHKGRKHEKYRGSTHVPGKVKKNFKNQNKHRYASTMPKYRGKVGNSEQRRINRLRQASGNKRGTNPFKNKIAKGARKNRTPNKKITPQAFKRSAKKDQQARLRSASSNKNMSKGRQKNSFQTKNIAKKNIRNRNKSQVQVNKNIARTPGKTSGVRRNTQAYTPKTRQTTRRKVVTVKQTKARANGYNKSTVTVRQPRANRTAGTYSATRPNRTATSYARSAGQHRSGRSSSGRMQRSAGRGRRW